MKRIHPLTEKDVPPETRVHFQRDHAAFGTTLNSTMIYAHCPPILNAAKVLGAAIEESGRVSRQLRCLINIKAASLVGCPF